MPYKISETLEKNLADPYKLLDYNEENDDKELNFKTFSPEKNMEKLKIKKLKPEKNFMFDTNTLSGIKSDEDEYNEPFDFDVDKDEKILNEFSDDLNKNSFLFDHNKRKIKKILYFLDSKNISENKSSDNKKNQYYNFNYSINNNKQNKDLLNNPEDLYKLKVDSIENFEKILINKTLSDLEKLPNSPIDKFKNKEGKNEKK